QTKQPLDPVLVQLNDVQTGKTIETAITDLLGRFGFVARAGKFLLKPQKKGYAFPSQISLGVKDQIFEHVYHGEVLSIANPTEIVAPNIPMDRLEYDFNQ